MNPMVPVDVRPTYPTFRAAANQREATLQNGAGASSGSSYYRSRRTFIACKRRHAVASRFALIAAALTMLAGPAAARADQDVATQVVGSGPADAFLDANASEMVRLGRERRNTVDRSIQRYTTLVQERVSAGLRVNIVERVLFRRETAGRIDWRRDGPVRIEVLGAREIIPIAIKEAQIPAGLRQFMPHMAFDPVDSDIFVRFDSTFLRHPLAAEAETHYRYRSGDTTTLKLPDGRTVRLLELIVIPRRDDAHLLSGSFWFDEDTHAVVRAVFRPARPFDFERDLDDESPGLLHPIRAELQYITVEYGLWELRWWLPRVVAAEGVFQVRSVSMPLRYERRYSEYTVEGDTAMLPAPADTASRPCRPPFNMTINIGGSRTDSAEARRQRERSARAAAAARRARVSNESTCLESFEVVIPADSLLIESPYLPGSAYAGNDEWLTATELEELERILDDLPEAPWQVRPPTFALGLDAPGLSRYNRVEALSLGVHTELDLGRLALGATARLGVADLEPNGELSIARETRGSNRRLTLYRRLAAANPDTRPLDTGNSINALLFGRDDGEYFRTIGGELTLAPSETSTQWYDLRLFGEHQKAASTETDFSVRHLLDSEHAFGPNIRAATADQFGVDLRLHTAQGLDPGAFRWGAEAAVTAQTGSFDFVRPAATVSAAIPFGSNALAIELAAGTSFGEPPIQSEWFLGGPATLRGYEGGIVHGKAFWRGRAELSRGIPALRLSLFGDVGWAGERAAFGTRDALAAAGIGVALLDGLVRFDVARALEQPTGWRIDFHISRGF